MTSELVKTAGAIGGAIATPLLGLLQWGGIGLTGGITVDITIFAITVYINKDKG